jgi:dihydrolipoamide dehydrogenase
VDDSGQVLGVDPVHGSGWLYAAGDVTGRAPLTHQGKYAARIAGAAIAARARGNVATPVAWSEYAATADHRAVPQVVFTDPQVAAVGRTAEQAAAEGLTVRTVDLDIAVAGSYVHAVDYTGRARMVVDTEREVLVGLTFVGPDVAEMLHAATIAVVGEVPLSRLWHAVPAYPTINEVWLRLLEAYRAKS